MRNCNAAILSVLLSLGALPAQASAPAPPTLDHVFDIKVILGKPVRVGDTPRGGRNIVPILGGRVEGPGIRAQVMPGGWDWQLVRRDGCIEIKADYMLQTDDGVVLNVVDTGVNCQGSAEAGPPRTHLVFEAPDGKYGWLGRAAFIGAAEPYSGAEGAGLKIRIYQAK